MADALLEQYWVAATVWMEAGGEPFQGQSAVAWVIRNRTPPGTSPVTTVLRPFQFSCWNTNSPTRARLAGASGDIAWRDCVAAAGEAFAGGVDPTYGATHYCATGLLGTPGQPRWYDPAKVTATIGRHVFLKL